ncbi:hypothetical protein GQ457_08G017130 [Hibiscus cannabinus]
MPTSLVRVGVVWVLLPLGALKFNVDGSAGWKLGLAWCGGVLWDDMGQILVMFSSLSGVMESNEAERLAISHTLVLL